MATNRWAVCLWVFAFTANLFAAVSPQQWKDRDARYQRDAALLAAEGRLSATRQQADAWALKYPRLEQLGARKSITEAAVRKAKLDKTLADLAVREAAVDVTVAAEQKRLADAMAQCESGTHSACDETDQSYAALFRAREARATLALEKTLAELEWEEYSVNGVVALVQAGAVEPSVAEEEKLRLEGKRAEVRTAQAQVSLAQKAARR